MTTTAGKAEIGILTAALLKSYDLGRNTKGKSL